MGSRETKIECQCGSHFKFDLEPVGGHAPRNVSCPSCGGDATQACENFIHFLRGQTAHLTKSGTRALKEINVACGCGTHLKLNLELAEQRAPQPVHCPACNIDLTSRANELIRGYVAAHALNGSPTAAPQPHKSPADRAHPERGGRAKPKAGPAAHPAGGAWGAAGAAAIGGAALGVLVWYGVVQFAGPHANWLAVLPGLLAGLGARFGGRGASPYHGVAAAGAALAASLAMACLLPVVWADRDARPHVHTAYQARLALAKSVVAAKDDLALRRLVGETSTNATVRVVYGKLGPDTITPELLAAWKQSELPKLRALADGSYSRAQFEREHLARYRAGIRWPAAFLAGFGLLGILFSVAGMIAAVKLGSP